MAALQEGTDGKDVPHAAPDASKADQPHAAPDADEPPPLRFDHKPEVVIGVPARLAPYAMQVRSQMIALINSKMEALIRAGRIDRRGFDLAVALWVGQDGRIGQVRFDRSSGDPAIDAMIDDEVRARLILPPPPNDMPQPIKVNIVNMTFPAFKRRPVNLLVR